MMILTKKLRIVLFAILMTTLSAEAKAGFLDDLFYYFMNGAVTQVKSAVSVPDAISPTTFEPSQPPPPC